MQKELVRGHSLFYWFSRCEPGMTAQVSVLDHLVVIDSIIIKLKCVSIISCEQIICQEFLIENELSGEALPQIAHVIIPTYLYIYGLAKWHVMSREVTPAQHFLSISCL